jgi:hypothetical protein
MENITNGALDVKCVADISLQKLELRIPFEMAEIFCDASNEIIQREDFPAFREQPIAKM